MESFTCTDSSTWIPPKCRILYIKNCNQMPEIDYLRLERLYISNCDFTRLSISRVKFIIAIRECNIETLEVAKSPNCILLNCKISHLTAKSKKIQSVIVNNCQLESADFRTQNIKELVLKNNCLTKFYGDFPKLQILDLSDNQIQHFEGDFPKLVWLCISDNPLNIIDIEAKKLRNLEMQRCQLREFTVDAPLHRLEIEENPLTVLEIYSPDLRILRCGGIEFQELTVFAKNLRRLMIINPPPKILVESNTEIEVDLYNEKTEKLSIEDYPVFGSLSLTKWNPEYIRLMQSYRSEFKRIFDAALDRYLYPVKTLVAQYSPY